VEPMTLEPGEVPADLLARLSFRQLRQSASTEGDRKENTSAVSERRRYGILERETGVEPATLSLGIKLATANSRAISATSTISGTVSRKAFRLTVLTVPSRLVGEPEYGRDRAIGDAARSAGNVRLTQEGS